MRLDRLRIFPNPISNPKCKNNTSPCYIKTKDCTMCGLNFPFHDIIFAHCHHVYHPWCFLNHFRFANFYADPSYSLMMPSSWLKSFGVTELDMHMLEKNVLEADENTRVDIIARWELVAMSFCPELGKPFSTLHVLYVQNEDLKLKCFWGCLTVYTEYVSKLHCIYKREFEWLLVVTTVCGMHCQCFPCRYVLHTIH